MMAYSTVQMVYRWFSVMQLGVTLQALIKTRLNWTLPVKSSIGQDIISDPFLSKIIND